MFNKVFAQTNPAWLPLGNIGKKLSSFNHVVRILNEFETNSKPTKSVKTTNVIVMPWDNLSAQEQDSLRHEILLLSSVLGYSLIDRTRTIS